LSLRVSGVLRLGVNLSHLVLDDLEVFIRIFLLLCFLATSLELILLGGIFVVSVDLEVISFLFLTILVLVLLETTFVVVRLVRLLLLGIEVRV
jgi:hypothetical protein